MQLFSSPAVAWCRKPLRCRLIVLSLGLATVLHVGAQTTAAPNDITISISGGTGAKAIILDQAALSRLGAKPVRTVVPWLKSSEPALWDGVPLSRLAAVVRAEGRDMKISSLNGYSAVIPWSDISRFDPILAWACNGKEIKLRDKGPLVVIYPFSQYNELSEKATFNDRSIWHANRIEIQ